MTILLNTFDKRTIALNPATQLQQPTILGRTGKPKLVLSGSLQNMFHSCNQKFHFARNFQNPARASGHAADAGTCLHEVTQHYMVHKDRDQALLRLFEFYPTQTDHLNAAKYRSLEDCYGTALQAFDDYEMHFPVDYHGSHVIDLKLQDGTKTPCVEIKFEIFIEQTILPMFDVYIAGAMDAILFAPFLQSYFVQDIKTHRDPKQELIQQKYEFANQTLPYHLVLSHITGEDVASFEVQYWTMYISADKPSTQFITYQKTQKDIEDYLLGFVKLLHSIRMNMDTDHWSKNAGSCVNWGRACQYVDACRTTSGNATIQDIILGDAQPHDRYASADMKPHIELTMAL